MNAEASPSSKALVGAVPSPLYHYAPAYRAALIVRDGQLRAFPIGYNLVWFSSNGRMEKTACWAGPTILNLVGKDRCRYVRFRWDGTATPYRDAKLPYTTRRKLDKKGRDRGSYPHEWFVLPGPIDLARLSLECQSTGDWRPMKVADLLSEFSDWRAEVRPDGLLTVQVEAQS
jgi:hypothetical protein